MKKIIYTIVVVLFTGTTNLFGQTNDSINFILNDWDKAVDIANKEGKNIYVFCTSNSCGWCDVMVKETFGNKRVIELMRENFVCLKFYMLYADIDKSTKKCSIRERSKRENEIINIFTNKFKILGYPTSMIFNKDKKLLNKWSGYYEEIDNFIEEINNSLDTNKQLKLTGISDEFKWEFSDDFRKTFLSDSLWWSYGDINQDSLSSFLGRQKDLFNEECWYLFYYSVNYKSEYSQFFLENIDKYVELYGRADVDDIISRYKQRISRNATKQKDKDIMLKEFANINNYYTDSIFELNNLYNLAYFFSDIEDWGNYFKTIEEIFEIDTAMFMKDINEFCWDIYEKSNDERLLNKAVVMMESIIYKKDNWYWYDTYAALLYKLKKYDKATDFAKLAIEIGKKANKNVGETENLLVKIIKAKGAN